MPLLHPASLFIHHDLDAQERFPVIVAIRLPGPSVVEVCVSVLQVPLVQLDELTERSLLVKVLRLAIHHGLADPCDLEVQGL